MNELVTKATVEELCAHRERAVQLYGFAVERMREAMKAHEQACQMGGRASLPILGVDSNDRWSRLDEFVPKMTVRMDRDIWRGLIVGTPIGSLMDRQERKAFEDSLEKEPPPATADNVRATLERLLGESDAIFRRGLVNAFKQLDRDYASNDGFKIGERIVITYGCSWDKTFGWFRLNRGETLQDVDRVMHVMDGKPAPEYQQGLQAALDTDMQLWNSRGERGVGEVTTPYWRAKYFKNGNIHLYPLNRELRDKANRIIAEHYGMVVPASREAREAEPSYQPKPGARLDEGFFPTPKPVIERVMELAEIEPGMACLEPSAGEGGLAWTMLEAGGIVRAIEINAERAGALMAELMPECADFLQIEPARTYDRIVMNPPFGQQQDTRHVLHALRFLKPGGRLVAIMSPSFTFRQDKLSEALRTVVARLNGATEKLPEGSFKVSGTNVNTIILTVNWPEAA